jgi:hypothetical protein
MTIYQSLLLKSSNGSLKKYKNYHQQKYLVIEIDYSPRLNRYTNNSSAIAL